MLDLHPRVHLDEEELPVLIEELDRAGPDIAQFSHRLGDNPADALALLGVEGRGGALLPDFLVATLKRAVALAKMNGVALRVAEHLNLDVARLGEIFLEIDGIAAERGPGFDPGGVDRLRNVVGTPGDLHAAAPSARRSLDDHRIADRGCDLARFGFVPDGALGARDARDPETLGGAFGLDLVAHHADVLGPRADEHDVVLLQDFRETRVLGQKAVARMNGVGAGDLARRDNGGNVEITVARRRRADAHALIGELDVHRVPVGGRIDRDGRDAELLGRTHDPERDFAPVGDQDLIEHRGGLPDRSQNPRRDSQSRSFNDH